MIIFAMTAAITVVHYNALEDAQTHVMEFAKMTVPHSAKVLAKAAVLVIVVMVFNRIKDGN